MQVPKRHLPVVGLLGLVVVAAAGGGIYYYQFILPHPTSCGVSAHRLIFMTAIIQELGGFTVTNAAYLNQSTLPKFNSTNGYDLSGVIYKNYKLADTKNKTINANVGDTITIYIKSLNTTDSRQYTGIPGHGFEISPVPADVQGILPSPLPFNHWYTVTFTVSTQGTYLYFCNQPCSNGHSSMNGSIVVGCGG